VGAVEGGLGGGHGEIEIEMIVGLEELEYGRRHLRGRGAHQGGGDEPGEERGGSHVAVVALVAHLERLGGEVLEIDGPMRADGAGEGGGERLVHPAQPVEDLRPVGAEAQHLAEAFVLDGVGAIAARRVLHDEDGHGGRHNAGHGSDRAEVVAGGEAHRAVVGEAPCRFRRGRPAFIEDGADHRTPHRSAHTRPFDRRSRVQDVTRPQARQEVSGPAHAHEHRPRGEDALESTRVRGGDLGADGIVRVVLEPCQEQAEIAIAARGRAPVELEHGGAVSARR